jgi:hypothetical protein
MWIGWVGKSCAAAWNVIASKHAAANTGDKSRREINVRCGFISYVVIQRDQRKPSIAIGGFCSHCDRRRDATE